MSIINFWNELKYFRNQVRAGYPRQLDWQMWEELTGWFRCFELRPYSWEECVRAADSFVQLWGGSPSREHELFMNLVEAIFLSSTYRGKSTFADIKEKMKTCLPKSQSKLQ